jgi:tRNA(Ile)-lysidine synthase TilS/MesJ
VLAHVMKTLNDQYNYGLELFLLSIDEGITGYRDDSLEVRLYCSQGRVTHGTGRLSNGINSSMIYH